MKFNFGDEDKVSKLTHEIIEFLALKEGEYTNEESFDALIVALGLGLHCHNEQSGENSSNYKKNIKIAAHKIIITGKVLCEKNLETSQKLE